MTDRDREDLYVRVAHKLEGMEVEDAWAIAYAVVDDLLDNDVLMRTEVAREALARIRDKVAQLRDKVSEVRGQYHEREYLRQEGEPWVVDLEGADEVEETRRHWGLRNGPDDG